MSHKKFIKFIKYKMSTIKIVFQEKGKKNEMINANQNMTFSELIQKYYKQICASKKDKMTKLFLFQGSEKSPEDTTKLSEMGLKDLSQIEIQSTEKAQTEPKKDAPKEEPPQEEAPQEEAPQEEAPQEEQPQEEPPQEEQPAEGE